MRILIFLCVLPVAILAQNYFEVSGQTQVFNLTAGAKAGWNPAIAVEKAAVKPASSVFRISAAGNGLFVRTGTRGIIGIFDICGRLALALTVEHDGFMPLSRGLANGIYVARFNAVGIVAQSARIAIIR